MKELLSHLKGHAEARRKEMGDADRDGRRGSSRDLPVTNSTP
jgi:hypothetical protein